MMNDKNKANKSKELASQPIDYVTSMAKGVSGLVPVAGSFLSELISVVIPNQRIDRIARFTEILDGKLALLEQKFLRDQLTNENFSDLLEEGLRQACRSLTDERREYIANLITNSLSSDDIEYIESKHILMILSEINDIEIIWLKSYSSPQDEEFFKKHSKILNPAASEYYNLGISQVMEDKETLQNSYKEHLSSLGLLAPKYKMDSKTNLPVFDNRYFGTITSGFQIQNYAITRLGTLLLKQIETSKE